jgi:GntR family transcriptional regulator/MocR family aminotransferase
VFELVDLPGELDEPSLLAAAARRSVGLEGVSWHRSTPREIPGVLIGYGALSEPALARAMGLVAEAIAET